MLQESECPTTCYERDAVISVREGNLSADDISLNNLLSKVPRFVPLPNVNQLSWRIRERDQMLLFRWCERYGDKLFYILLVHLV